MVRRLLRTSALVYLALLLLIPLAMVFYRTFAAGLAPVLEVLSSSEFTHALWLTLVMVACAVPVTTVLGTLTAIVLVRHRFPGREFLNRVVDIPFAVSPVIVGLALILVYGETGWFGSALAEVGIEVIFTPVGMVLASIFTALPFVIREVMPMLHEVGIEQEQAASTLGASSWQTFRRITLPTIRWGVSYGVVLSTARVLGEFGAVAVVSGRLVGETETLPLFVERSFLTYDVRAAFAAAMVLAVLALCVLFAMKLVKPKEAAS